MDASDPLIEFDLMGVCNHCKRYDSQLSVRTISDLDRSKKLSELISRIKESGKGNEYDCIIGVSGGVDSTYVAYLCHKFGLRPLAVHFDNGWNSEVAVSNIEKVLNKLNIDLFTYVIDWQEFMDLQLSFLKASTPDGEIPTDHAINALLFKESNRRGIKYIINGMNFSSESISVPSWAYGHSDWRYIKNVHKIFGLKKLITYPKYSILNLFWWMVVRRIKVVSILNYIDYQKKDVLRILKDELEWIDYGGKHYESVYTRFYQGFILPTKFNIDKRRAHYSDLINSGQLDKTTAIQDLKLPAYKNEMFMVDYHFVLKKLDISQENFTSLMNMPVKSFNDYKNSFKFITFLKKIMYILRKYELLSR